MRRSRPGSTSRAPAPATRVILAIMELDLKPETQARLNELAQRTHRGTDELLAEAVDHLVAYNDSLGRKVGDSMAAAGRGETVPDEEVHAWLRQRERG